MKKVLAFVICAIFVLSTASFAFWGFGGKKAGETKVMTREAKIKTTMKVKKVETKKVMVKKLKKAKKTEKKGATPAVPPRK